MTKRKKF